MYITKFHMSTVKNNGGDVKWNEMSPQVLDILSTFEVISIDHVDKMVGR